MRLLIYSTYSYKIDCIYQVVNQQRFFWIKKREYLFQVLSLYKNCITLFNQQFQNKHRFIKEVRFIKL